MFSDYCVALRHGIVGECPGADVIANKDAAAHYEFRSRNGSDDPGAQAVGLADPSRELSGVGLQSARADQ